MCESRVFLQYPDGRIEKIADDVLVVTQQEDKVILQWLFDQPRSIPGVIQEVNAIKHTITLKVWESAEATAVKPIVSEAAPKAEPKAARPHIHEHVHADDHSHGRTGEQ